jgi:rhodanese-related sulfurtransferase
MKRGFHVVFVLLMSLISIFAGDAAGDKPAQPSTRRVNAEEFATLVGKTNTVTLDVRTPEEFNAGHIKGALLIDFRSPEFDAKVSKLDKSKIYLVYCAGGGRSALACKKMTTFNFTNLVDLAFGFTGWQQAKKPVEK